MKYNYAAHQEIREELRTYLKNLREMAKNQHKKEEDVLKKVIFTEPRKGYYNNQYVNRLVLFLRGTGCSLARETGGCTFCGFYNATNFGEKLRDEDYLAQINNVINDELVNFDQYPLICLYNDGSMLREEEISFQTLLNIIKILDGRDTVKKIVIEARVEDVTEEKLIRIQEVTTKEIEIAVGFESAHPAIRDLCINKGFENNVFETNSKIAKKNNISLVPLLMLKPPFLSEKEAIDDYIKSLIYLEKFNLKRIDMELPTVEAYTLVYDLWINNLYRPAWLWSVIEVLQARERLGLKTPLYISPMIYSVSAEAKASNCPKCDKLIYQAFENFNQNGDISVFEEIACSCKEDWVKTLHDEELDENLTMRVRNVLQKLTKISNKNISAK